MEIESIFNTICANNNIPNCLSSWIFKKYINKPIYNIEYNECMFELNQAITKTNFLKKQTRIISDYVDGIKGESIDYFYRPFEELDEDRNCKTSDDYFDALIEYSEQLKYLKNHIIGKARIQVSLSLILRTLRERIKVNEIFQKINSGLNHTVYKERI